MQKDTDTHVLIISHGIPSKSYPTNGLFAYDQACALASIGKKVTYLAFDLRSIRKWRRWGLTQYVIDGFDAYSLNIPLGPISHGMSRNVGKLCLPSVLKRVFQHSGRPDIIHAHFANMGHLGLMIKDLYSIPLVYTEHASGVQDNDIGYITEAKDVWENSDAVIAVSSSLAKVICGYNCTPTVVGNIIDPQFSTFPLPNRQGDMRFVSVGSLIPRKGHRELIDAFSRLPETASLRIIGSGPEKAMLERLILQKNLSNRVKLMGQCTRKEMLRVFSTSDCFVLASKCETFGVAYSEAMAFGLPVVATRCGGPEDFVSKECGLLIPLDDNDALFLAMLEVGRNMSYSPSNIRNYILNKYSSNTIARELEGIYSSVLDNR